MVWGVRKLIDGTRGHRKLVNGVWSQRRSSFSLDSGIYPSLTPAGHSFLHSTVALKGGGICKAPEMSVMCLISTSIT